MRNYLLALLSISVLLCSNAVAQSNKKPVKGYNIAITIDNSKDSMLYLGSYYLGDTYAIDSAARDKKDTYTFANKEKYLMPGLYFFTNKKGNFVEFVNFREEMKKVQFHTKAADWEKYITVKGSQQNAEFIDYKTESAKLSAHGRTPNRGEADSLKEAFIRNHPDNMLAMMMNATRPIIVPVVNEKGDTLSQRERNLYYVTHYWDNVPLNEDFLTRTPKSIFVQIFRDFVDKVLRGGTPADLIPIIDSVCEKARGSQEVFHFMVHHFAEYYLQSKVMVYDEIYVHMIDRYYATGEAFWASPSTITDETNRANKWRNLLVGKVAPELILYDTNHAAHSLHRMPNQYKLLIFWSPSCGHCKTTIPEINTKLKELRKEFDIQAFAIFTEPDENTTPKWLQFINDHDLNDGWIHLNGSEANCDWREVYDVTTTPQIYLLDKDNKIIAKKLNAEIFGMAMEGERNKK